MPQLKQYLKNIFHFIATHPKLVIFTILIIIIISIIPSLIFNLTRPGNNISINNQSSLSISSNGISNLKNYLANIVGNDSITITIREDSISSNTIIYDNHPVNHFTFLVDVDSIQQTYFIDLIDTSQPMDSPSVSITCPKISESKYPESECNTIYNNSHDIDLWLPYHFTLDTGEKIIVKDTTIDSDGKNIQTYLYSCNSLDPPLEKTETLVKDWTKNVVKDPLADKYKYNIRYGYCENDPPILNPAL